MTTYLILHASKDKPLEILDDFKFEKDMILFIPTKGKVKVIEVIYFVAPQGAVASLSCNVYYQLI